MPKIAHIVKSGLEEIKKTHGKLDEFGCETWTLLRHLYIDVLKIDHSGE